MLRGSCSNAPLHWPFFPRPFDEEAFGSWLGRVATKYWISVTALWKMSVDQPSPHLEKVGWIPFPCVEQSARDRLSSLARLNGDRLDRIQTSAEWISPRRRLPYCFKCLVLNDADVTAPRWKLEWLRPGEQYCSAHRWELETVPANVLNNSPNLGRALLGGV
ncbi:TniQ family protein [Robbsia andropogonis]|uniref:TniQ family protein n=1 Tax=Robbsia andropogonis TaxID=28092 RepID=UPI00389AE80E